MAPPAPQPETELTDLERERAELLAAIEEGTADAERGDTTDGDKFFDQLEAELREKYNLSAG